MPAPCRWRPARSGRSRRGSPRRGRPARRSGRSRHGLQHQRGFEGAGHGGDGDVVGGDAEAQQLGGAGRQQASQTSRLKRHMTTPTSRPLPSRLGAISGCCRSGAWDYLGKWIIGRRAQASAARWPTTVRPKPAMLGILRGLAIRRILPTPRSRRIWAPMPNRRGSHFWAGRRAGVGAQLGEEVLRRSGGCRAARSRRGRARRCAPARCRREGVAAAARVEEVEHRDGLVDAHQGFDRRAMRPCTIARCTSPEVLSLKAHRRKGPWGVDGFR